VIKSHLPWAFGVVGLVWGVAIAAQTPASPAFEVASVKPNKSGDSPGILGAQPGGRFTATNQTLRFLIRNAYQVQDFQIAGAPDWIASDRFDIVAKANGNPPIAAPVGQAGPMLVMLRSLLADRFKLVVHHEMRDLPIYALVLASSDRRLGAQLRPVAVDCAAVAAARARGGPLPPPPQPNERLTCGMRFGAGRISGGALQLSQVANILSQSVQRVVMDRTGLVGAFDVDLTWTPDQLSSGAAAASIDPNRPSIFTAVQEQLGLKLESTKGPVDVLVIDHVEHPTKD
jgi:uncharacterized protein (TIGR03435 family)